MASIRVTYQLGKPGSKEPTSLYQDVRVGDMRFRLSLPFRILPEKWDKGQQQLKGRDANAAKINRILAKRKLAVQGIYIDCVDQGRDFTKALVVQRLDLAGMDSARGDIWQLYERFLKFKAAHVSTGTIKNYHSLRSVLQAYEQKRHIKLHPGRMGDDFYEDFRKYVLYELKRVDDTFGKHIKQIKTFLNYLYSTGVISNTRYRAWKAIQSDPQEKGLHPISLGEAKAMYALNLPERLAKAVDYVLIQCFSGLRSSDVAQLQEHHIHDSYIEITMMKGRGQTRKPIYIPITPPLRKVLDRCRSRYEGDHIAPRMSVQKVNAFIKEVGMIMEMDQKIEIQKKRGTHITTEVKRKWELLTTHLFRKSFATISIELGIPSRLVMEIMGQKDWRSFRHYELYHRKLLNDAVKPWDAVDW